MSLTFGIRRAKAADTNALNTLARYIFPETVLELNFEVELTRASTSYWIAELPSPPQPRPRFSWLSSLFISSSPIPRTKAVGFAGMWLKDDHAELVVMGTLPDYRQQGVGAKLLEKMVAAAKLHKMRRFDLELRHSNTVARDFYLKHNFRTTGERTGYYQNRNGGAEDALLMAQTLTTP